MKVLEGVEGGGPATFTVGQSRPRSLSTGSLASTGGAAASSEDHCSSMDTSADALLLHSSLEASTDPLVYKPSVPLKPKPRKVSAKKQQFFILCLLHVKQTLELCCIRKLQPMGECSTG